MQNDYELVIGLEVHAQLLTRTKLFCRDAVAYGAAPNSLTSAYTLAMPGTLPRLNKEAVRLMVRLGLAMDCHISQHSLFARKNYFYPDLPKGFQTSQHTAPLCVGGQLRFTEGNEDVTVVLNRIHLEEDAGKSSHDLYPSDSAIDLNRAGTPLAEIVTEPCLHSALHAARYLTELRRLLRWLGVCDGNMEQGSLRCDANVSVRRRGTEKLGTKVEIKNLNSIAFVRKAIDAEAARQMALLEAGGTVLAQTRSYDAATNSSFALREKEEANDYRYFTEPDLPPLVLSDAFVSNEKERLPELPLALETGLQEKGLSAYDAAQMTADKATADYFEALTMAGTDAKTAANWLSGPVRNYLNEQGGSMAGFGLAPERLQALIGLVTAGQVSQATAAGRLMPHLLDHPEAAPLAAAQALGLLQVSDAGELEKWIDEVIAAWPDKVADYRKGKKQLLGMFVGEVKKRSRGKADVKLAGQLLERKLG